MRLLCFSLLAIFLLLVPIRAAASDELLRMAGVELLLEQALANNLIAGGVVVIGNSDGIIHTAAKGVLDGRPDAPLLNEQTIFDLASLTKVIATTPAVMMLVDEGKISLTDPLARWFPEFRKSDLTILNLLTHTSGLVDFDLRPGQTMATAVSKAAKQKKQRPGSSFNYADINFILLGELIHRVSGLGLDQFCREKLYVPLGAHDTMFAPPPGLANSIAPTLGISGGTVQDRNARRLGSVAGHAGLFSSGSDLARFGRLMLGRGAIDGKRILSEQAVSQMTSPYFCSNDRVVRALGWDMESPFSAPKGTSFSHTSFGHTGYSGTSIWVDPQHDLFVILLTNRLDYRNTTAFNQLRRDVSTIAAGFSTFVGMEHMPLPRELAKTNGNLLRGSHRELSVRAREVKLTKVTRVTRGRIVLAYKKSGKKLVKQQARKQSGRRRV